MIVFSGIKDMNFKLILLNNFHFINILIVYSNRVSDGSGKPTDTLLGVARTCNEQHDPPPFRQGVTPKILT